MNGCEITVYEKNTFFRPKKVKISFHFESAEKFEREKMVLSADLDIVDAADGTETMPRLSSSRRGVTKRRSVTKRRVGIVAAVVVLATLLSSASTVASTSINDCRSVRQAYSARGLDIKDVPRQPRQGKVRKFATL
jgi:hypothetical protein